MADERLRIARTGVDVLLANLRGEVGEAVTTWLLLRHFMATASRLRSDDVRQDLKNSELSFLWLLEDKLRDELTARLSELADDKIGRTNFYFATRKLQRLEDEAREFTRFIVRKKLRQKRNQEIAHREQPEQFFKHTDIRIPYRNLVRALAIALRLMKRLDRFVLGPAAPFLWKQARKRRYELSGPPRALYMLVPYFYLPGEERVKIIDQEEREGKIVWSEIATTLNGQPTTVLACKEWGVVLLGDRCLALPQYPLQRLESLTFDDVGSTAGPANEGSNRDERNSPTE